MSVAFKPGSSGSTATTLTQAEPIHVILQLHQDPKARVVQLLKLMGNSSLFPPSALEDMQGWAEESLNVYFDDLSSDAAKEEASKVLSYLLIDVIRPAMLNETNQDIQDQILDIEDEFFKVLKSTLPNNVDAEEFIKQRELNHRKIQMFVKKISLEKFCNQKSEEKLYSAGHELNQQNLDNFENLKGGLLKLKTGRDVQTKQMQGDLNTADKKVHQTTSNLLDVLETAKAASKEMQATSKMFEQARRDCLDNARGVTKL